MNVRNGSLASRRNLNAIWQGITIEEFLNIPLLFLFLAGGYINIPFVHSLIVSRVWTLAFWLGSLSFFIIYRMRVHIELWTIRFFIAYVAWCCASALWSDAPLSTTYSPILSSLAVFMYCNYIIDRFTPEAFLRILIWTVTIAMAMSIVYGLFFPSVGVESETNVGAWKGVFTQKNTCGLACCISFALVLGFKPSNSVDRIWRYASLLLTLVVVIKTESRESWLVILTVAAFSVGFMLVRRLEPQSRLPAVIALGLLLTAGVLIIVFDSDLVLGLLGRDRTLTGRTQIWDGVILMIGKRPWMGYGMYGVWGRAISYDIVVRAGWEVTSAHNTYLEVLLNYGILGLLIFLPIPILSILFTTRAILNYALERYEVYIYLIVSIMLLGLVTSNLTTLPGISLPLLLYAVTNLERVERSGLMKLSQR